VTVTRDRRSNHSVRAWDSSWADLAAAAAEVQAAPSTILGDAADALAGYIRCSRCGEPVPLAWGDLTGSSLITALADAVTQVSRQKCRAHLAVTAGCQRPPQAPAASGGDDGAAEGEKPAQARTGPQGAVLEAAVARLVDRKVAEVLEALHVPVPAAGAPLPPVAPGTAVFKPATAGAPVLPVHEVPEPPGHGGVPLRQPGGAARRRCPHRLQPGAWCKTCQRPK
jgi:hypothetical protein